MSTVLEEEVQTVPKLDDGGRGFDTLLPGFGGGGEGPRAFALYQTGVWVLTIPIVMLFLGLTSSLVVRQGVSDDWVPVHIPTILGLNTVILLASSFTLEKARRSLDTTVRAPVKPWLWLTNGLGLAFVAGQLLAWRQLVAQGAFLASNPSNSFFYILTATHGAHLMGGIVALLYLTFKSLGGEFNPRRQSALKATAIYWHFIAVLWIYLLFLLIFWR